MKTEEEVKEDYQINNDATSIFITDHHMLHNDEPSPADVDNAAI
jgi:hypothetical protein